MPSTEPLYRICCECRTRHSEAVAHEPTENSQMQDDPDYDDGFDEDDGDLDDEPVFDDVLGNASRYNQRLLSHCS